MLKPLTRLLGGSNEGVLKKMRPKVEEINELEPEFEGFSQGQLRAKTDEFRTRLDEGEEIEDLVPEAFAAVREAAKRTLGQRHFDVQLMGGIVLNEGKIAEMKTGRGQDSRGYHARLPELPHGQGRPRGNCERLPGPARRAVDGGHLRLPGVSVGTLQHEAAHVYDASAEGDDGGMAKLRPVARGRGVPGGHHIRDQQRVRVRLP